MSLKDIFFTILAIWVLWRIFSGTRLFYSSTRNNRGEHNTSAGSKKEGETTLSQTSSAKGKKQKKDLGGEYVDYEEIK